MSTAIALPPAAQPPVSAATTSAAAAPAANAPRATVVDGATAALAALAGGAPLSGTVAPGGPGGVIVLLTALGNVSLATDLPLAAGATMTLQAQAANPGSAVILAVNGSAPVAPPATPTPAATPAAAPVLVDLGTTIAATVVAPPPSAAAGPPVIAALPSPATAGSPSTPSAPTVAASPGVAAAVPITAVAATPASPDGTNAAPSPASLDGNAPTVAATTTTTTTATTTTAIATPTVAALPPAAPLLPGTSLAMRILAVQPVQPATAAGEPPAPGAAPALTGTIRQAAAGAAPVAETPAGPLQLRGAPPLRAGTRVALRLLSDTPAAAELTILPDAAPPAEPTSGRPPAAAPPEPLETTTAPPATEAATAAEPPAVTAQSPAAPTAAPRAQPSETPAPGPEPVTAPFATPAEPTPAASATPSPPDTEAPSAPPIRVTLASPVSSAAAPARPVEQILTGTVLPDQSNGRAPLLVETPLGILAVSPRLAVPSGSLLLLAAPDAVAPPLGANDRLAQPDKGWASLAGALPALEHAAPALAAQLRAELTPQAGGDRLAASFLFLIDALRTPTGPRWPGELVAKALAAAGRDDDKDGLADDLGEARRIAAAPATGNWQVFLLPLVEGPLVRPLRLYLKRRDKAKRENAEDSARFVLEFELSRFGALQLDGFVRPKRFDLLLRTKAPLGAALEAMVGRIFHDRVAAAGLGGTIDFTTVPRFDIAPLDGMREHVGLAV